MANVGEPKRRVTVDEPIEAPTFVRPVRKDTPTETTAPAIPWLDPNKVPVHAPERELVTVGG